MNRAARKINSYKHYKKHKIYALKKATREKRFYSFKITKIKIYCRLLNIFNITD